MGNARLPFPLRAIRPIDRCRAVRDLCLESHHAHRAQPRLVAARERPHRPVPPRLDGCRRCRRAVARDPRAQGPAREHDDRALRRPRRRSLDARVQGRPDPRHGTVHRHHLDAARDSRSRARAGHRPPPREDHRHRADVPRAAGRRGEAPVSAFRHRPVPRRVPNSPIRRTSRPTSRTIRRIGIAKAFSITDATYTLLASSRGLELYAHRLDPGNHCNLLHLFELDAGRTTGARCPSPAPSAHYKAGWQDNPTSAAGLANDFLRLEARARGTRGREAGVHRRAWRRPVARARPARASRRSTAKAATRSTAAPDARRRSRAMPAFDISFKLR